MRPPLSATSGILAVLVLGLPPRETRADSPDRRPCPARLIRASTEFVAGMEADPIGPYREKDGKLLSPFGSVEEVNVLDVRPHATRLFDLRTGSPVLARGHFASPLLIAEPFADNEDEPEVPGSEESPDELPEPPADAAPPGNLGGWALAGLLGTGAVAAVLFFRALWRRSRVS